MATTYQSILDAVRSVVAGLTLPGIDPANVVRQSDEQNVSEERDAVPRVTVGQGRQRQPPQRVSFEGLWSVPYDVLVTCHAPQSAQAPSAEDAYLAWQGPIENAFAGPLLPGVPAVWDTEVFPDLPLDRARLRQGWARVGVGLRFHATEAR